MGAFLQNLARGGPEQQQQLNEYLSQLSTSHGASSFLSLLAERVPGPPMSEKFQALLNQLKSGDEVIIMQGVIDLATELSMAQDTAISQQVLEQFLPPLIDCLKMNAFPEIVCNSFLPYSLCNCLHNQCSRHYASDMQ